MAAIRSLSRQIILASFVGAMFVGMASAQSFPYREFPQTDFSKRSVSFDEILSGGPPRDGIPAIDDPQFVPVSAATFLESEPLISFHAGGSTTARGYPVRYLIYHEIVNDTVGGQEIAVTFCPLCNAAVVYDRNLGGRLLDFGTTGRLRNSDLVMYDRQTESWWQQFTGVAIIGELVDQRLTPLPSRFESLARFRDRFPNGEIMAEPANHQRPYGRNPYSGYDSLSSPFLYNGSLPDNVPALVRVVSLEDRKQAWTLPYLARKRVVTLDDGTEILWLPGQNSALDESIIAQGKDVGNVIVRRQDHKNEWQDVIYFIDFAFSYHAFFPHGEITN